MSKAPQGKDKHVSTKSVTEEQDVESDDENEPAVPPGRRKSTPGWSDPQPVEGKKSTMSRRVSMAAGAVRSSVTSTSSGPRATTGEGGPGAGAARQSVVGTSRMDILRRGSMAAQNRRASMAAMRESKVPERPSHVARPSSGQQTRKTISAPATNVDIQKLIAAKKKMAEYEDTEAASERKRECWKPVRSGRESTILFSGCNNPMVIDLEDHQETGCRDRTLESVRHFCRDRENRTNICYRSSNTTDSRSGSQSYCEKSYNTRKDFHSFHCTTEIRPLWMHGLRDFDESGSDFLFATSSSFSRKNDIRSEDMINKFGKDDLESEATINRESKKASKSEVNSPQNELRDNEQKGQTSAESSRQSTKKPREDKSNVTGHVSSQKSVPKKSEDGRAKKDYTSSKESKRNS